MRLRSRARPPSLLHDRSFEKGSGGLRSTDEGVKKQTLSTTNNRLW
jgi:hypothetical protein